MATPIWARLDQARSNEERQEIITLAVSEASLRGLMPDAIARELGINESMVQFYLEKCKDLWMAQAIQNAGELVARELQALERIRNLAYTSFELSCISANEAFLAKREGRQPVPDQVGDQRFLNTLLTTSEQIRKLLGLDKQKPVDVNVNHVNYEELVNRDAAELVRLHSEAIAGNTSTRK